MKHDTVLQLGDFKFSRLEIPEKIPFGGDQHLTVHELVGGVRVVDAMGRADKPIEWSGLLQGPDALQRARHLDGLRVAGQPLALTWHELAFYVVIQSLHCDFKRFYDLPYRLSCVVVHDMTQPVQHAALTSVKDAVAQDTATAKTLGGQIGDSSLSGLLQTLDQMTAGITDFGQALRQQINPVLTTIAAAIARAETLADEANGVVSQVVEIVNGVQKTIAAVGGVVTDATTLGGLLPDNPVAQRAARLISQAQAMARLPALLKLKAVLGRIRTVLAQAQARVGKAVGDSGKTITVAGGNLFSLAASEYNDASAWTAIARANGLVDPVIDGVHTLWVPPLPGATGGVLNA